jgi:hypothetical protein
MRLTLTIAMLAALATGCAGNAGKPSVQSKEGSKQDESKSSVISDLQSARLSASTLSARKLMYKKVEGILAKGQPAKYKAYYSGEVLRIVQEESNHGDYGESEKEYFLDAEGRLFYYAASDERAKQSAKEKVKTRVAYDASGRVVGSEKTVNGQPAKLPEAEIKAIRSRLDTLRKAADASRKPKAS